jgi:glycosyltransferase involved in cell wall biosynthesis
MKIALLGTSFPFRGGLSDYNERLVREMQKDGHQVTIYTFSLQYPNFLFPGKSQYSDQKRPTDLNIVECINSLNPINWLRVGNRLKKENYELIIVGYWIPFMAPCLGTIIKRIKSNVGTKVISIVHNIIPHEKRIGDRLLSKYFTNQVDAFIGMSANVLIDIQSFDDQKPRILSPHPVYDHFGVITSKSEALKKLKLDANYSYILFFGLIRKYKGLDLLLNALADERLKEKNLKLIIAGEYYDDKSFYKNIIKAHSLEDKVIETDGFVSNEDVQHYFNTCDLVVQPYKTATQSGVTQIAYHFEKPMVVTNVGGLEEMCPHEKVGYVVEPNSEEIAAAILRFFEQTDQEKMKASIQEEKKKYSWSILTKNIYSLFSDI